MTNLVDKRVGRKSWNTAGLRMSRENSYFIVRAFSAENQAVGFEQWLRKKCAANCWTTFHSALPLLLQADFCRSWAFRGQPPTSQLGRVGPTTGTFAALHFDCSLQQMPVLQAKNSIYSISLKSTIVERGFVNIPWKLWFSHDSLGQCPTPQFIFVGIGFGPKSASKVPDVLYFCAIDIQRSRTGASLISDQPQRTSKNITAGKTSQAITPLTIPTFINR